MANKTIGQLTELTPNSSTELAIFSNNTTGKTTVSALLNTENFTSEDTSLTPSSTTSVDLLQGTDSWSQRFVKVSQMFKNIRWILSKLGSTDSKIGNTDISNIGNGTLTGAINTLNSNFKDLTAATSYTSNGITFVFRKYGRVVVVSYTGTPIIQSAILTNAFVSPSITLSTTYYPIGTSPVIAYVPFTATKIVQINISTSGVFQYGYANEQIPINTTVRPYFIYISKD